MITDIEDNFTTYDIRHYMLAFLFVFIGACFYNLFRLGWTKEVIQFNSIKNNPIFLSLGFTFLTLGIRFFVVKNLLEKRKTNVIKPFLQ